MPRAFSEPEREHIAATLLEQGHRLFATQGLRKTSVEELATAAGISKGAFYLFFDSKEELFFDLLERYEARIKAELLALIARDALPPKERMRNLLEHALRIMHTEALFTHLGRTEYELLLRRLPPERVSAHLQGDDAFAQVFAEAWAAQGVGLTLPPPIVSGMIRALFFVSMHEEDLSPEVYPVVMAELTTMLAHRLIGKEHYND